MAIKKPVKKLVKAKVGTSVKKECPSGTCGTYPNCYPCNNVSTADSTHYYADKEYKAKLRGLTANTKSEMDKQFAIMTKAKQDRYRQTKKGKPGYDKNGFPIKKNKVGGSVKSKNKK
jgi:hypothetical protein